VHTGLLPESESAELPFESGRHGFFLPARSSDLLRLLHPLNGMPFSTEEEKNALHPRVGRVVTQGNRCSEGILLLFGGRGHLYSPDLPSKRLTCLSHSCNLSGGLVFNGFL
jgi:hypothetical protein